MRRHRRNPLRVAIRGVRLAPPSAPRSMAERRAATLGAAFVPMIEVFDYVNRTIVEAEAERDLERRVDAARPRA